MGQLELLLIHFSRHRIHGSAHDQSSWPGTARRIRAKDPPFSGTRRALRVCGFSLSRVAWCDLDLVMSGMLGQVNGVVWGSGGCVWSSGSGGHTVISQLARTSAAVTQRVRVIRM
jgi:hypothetical protein